MVSSDLAQKVGVGNRFFLLPYLSEPGICKIKADAVVSFIRQENPEDTVPQVKPYHPTPLSSGDAHGS
jgi:hypothetical protein